AAVLSVELGRYVTGRVIQIPPLVELVTINGRFVYSDGKPVEEAGVMFIPDDETRFESSRGMTDKSGTLVLRAPKGAIGKISGQASAGRRSFEGCANAEALLKESASDYGWSKSAAVQISTVELPDMLEIRLAFGYCESSKKVASREP
ncbi:MAG: hypothetical protein H0U23_14230, partial [Blastocatellia bacterium]|nr:hypothetical protein [Blastocatellia bacterium]